MKRYLHKPLLALAFALALGVAPAVVRADETTEAGAAASQSAATTSDLRTFNLPVATPIGTGWYAAASTLGQSGMMARAEPWSNDLMPVRGTARVAIIDGQPQPGVTMAGNNPDTPSGGPDRLVTSVAQWLVPEENALWEVRLTSLRPEAPFSGAGVMRLVDGETGQGSERFPRSLAYIALFGPADIFRNGQRIATGLNGRVVVTQGVRTPETGRLLDTPNVRPDAIEYHVMVEGSIPGRERDSLYVYWPSATLDLRNLSTPVALLPAEMQVARSFFGESAVAGFREDTPEPLPALTPLLIVSLRDRFLARSTPSLRAGAVELRVTNDSGRAQGFAIEGPGVSERTQILQPGEQATLSLNLQAGTYQIAAFNEPDPKAAELIHRDTITVTAE